jgi:hypothetical protein
VALAEIMVAPETSALVAPKAAPQGSRWMIDPASAVVSPQDYESGGCGNRSVRANIAVRASAFSSVPWHLDRARMWSSAVRDAYRRGQM